MYECMADARHAKASGRSARSLLGGYEETICAKTELSLWESGVYALEPSAVKRWVPGNTCAK